MIELEAITERIYRPMDYTNLKKRLMQIESIDSEAVAESVVKSVLGHLVNRLHNVHAQEIVSKLPRELKNISSHQQTVTAISVEQYINDIREQFGFSEHTAREVSRIIFHALKGNFSYETIQAWESDMPSDWAKIIEQA